MSDQDVASRLERLEHQLKLIQFAAEHPDCGDFLLTTISVTLDFALDEVKSISVLLKFDRGGSS